MKKLLLSMLLLLIASSAYSDVITLRADPWCPYNCEPGENPGFMVEITREVFEKAGHTVDYQLLNWARAKRMLASGRITAVVGMTLRKDSKKRWVFPDIEQGQEQFCFYVPKGAGWRYGGIASLAKITLGVINSYGYGPEMDRHFEVNLTTGRIRKMAGIDALIEDRTVMGHALQQSQKTDQVEEAGCMETKSPVFIVFSHKDPLAKEYAELLGEGTRMLRTSGRLKVILDKYEVKDWR